MTGGAVTCLKEKCTQKRGEKESAFWLWGTEAQNGTLSQVCVPTKVHFHSLEEQLPQNISYRRRSACSSPTICRLLFLVFSPVTESFFFSPCWQKKIKFSLLFHLSQQASGVSSLVSFCSALENHIIPSAMRHFRGWWIISCLDRQNIVFHLTKLDNFFEHQGLPPSAIRRISSLYTQTVGWGNCRAELRACWMVALLNSISH